MFNFICFLMIFFKKINYSLKFIFYFISFLKIENKNNEEAKRLLEFSQYSHSLPFGFSKKGKNAMMKWQMVKSYCFYFFCPLLQLEGLKIHNLPTS